MPPLICNACGRPINPVKETYASVTVRLNLSPPPAGGKNSHPSLKGDLDLCSACSSRLHLPELLNGKSPFLLANGERAGDRGRESAGDRGKSSSLIPHPSSLQKRKPKHKRTKRSIPFSERKSIYAACEKTRFPLRNRAMLLLSRTAGLRASELIALDVRQLWDGATYVEQPFLRPEQTKGRRTGREIYLVNNRDRTRGAIRDYLLERRKKEGGLDLDSPLFVSCTGQRLTRCRLDQLCDELSAAAQVPAFTWHDWRRTCATELKRDGVDIEDIQQVLGHSSPDMTRRYIQRDAEAPRIAVAHSRA
jgi:integrase